MTIEQTQSQLLALYQEIDRMREILGQLQQQQQQVAAGIQQRQGKLELLRDLLAGGQPEGEERTAPPS